MPASFRPHGNASGALSLGMRIEVLIDGLSGPAKLEVSRFQRPSEIAWRGGIPGVLSAEHRFVFDSDGATRTRVTSIETWSGFLSFFARRLIERSSERVGGEQLDALARAVG